MAEESRSIIVTTNNLNNSNKARREAEEKAHKDLPSVSSDRKRVSARVKKDSFGTKLKKAFFGENVENVGDYMFFEVGIPALKATISDMFSNGLEVLLFGESRGRRRGNRESYTDYARVSRSDRDHRDSSDYRRDRDRSLSYRDITFDSKADAKECLSEVFDYVNEYDRISVAVYISILNRYLDDQIRTTWQDDRNGWYKEDLSGRTEPIRTRYGWEIDFPRPGKIS